MAKKITNNLAKQISHFQKVWGSYWREYAIAESTSGEKVLIKVREDSRIKEILGGSMTHALLWGDQVYVAESFMRNHPDALQKFVIAHEIGHWVTKEDLLVPGNAMESEIRADEFAMSIYGHDKTVVDAARESLMTTVDRGIVKLRTFNQMTPTKDIQQLADRMAVLSERVKRLK